MFDNTLRKLVPSAARLSYNGLFKVVGNMLSNVLALPFNELRKLPPNHLRVRVGVGNRLINNHVFHLSVAYHGWLYWLSRGYLRYDSDIVEIGCGCGRIALPLMQEWFEGSYIGVDIDDDAIAYCQTHFPPSRFTFMLSPHTSMTYPGNRADRVDPPAVALTIAPPESKDFVLATSLYTHLLELEAREYLQKSFAMLRPGGVMFLTFFALEHTERGGRWNFAHQMGNASIENLTYPEAAVAYREAFMRGMAEDAGFRQIEMLPRSGHSVVVAWK